MAQTIPADIADPINAQILEVSEDQIEGFSPDPFGEIAARSGIDLDLVLERIHAMLEAGTIRRVRQTLMATNLARGALIAWLIDPDQLNDAFEWMHTHDPFTGHVVVRSTDGDTPGSRYRLWTTLKVPQGYSFKKHCAYLLNETGASEYKAMPAKRLFKLGVGHMRRRKIEPGDKADAPAQAVTPSIVELSDEDWRVLMALKRELSLDEVRQDVWAGRAAEAGMSERQFVEAGKSLNQRGGIGRFSTFLEHVKPVAGGDRVTRFNGLFHWAVPTGRELEAGEQVGRFHIMTHAYWREAGPDFGNVNIMGVVHGTSKDRVMQHKAAIDAHLTSCGIPLLYTNVFWGGRSEIKPSEISPIAYRDWCRKRGIDPQSMRD